MRASTPDTVSGEIEIAFRAATGQVTDPAPWIALLSTWERALELGFFGPCTIEHQGDAATHEGGPGVRLRCAEVPRSALRVLDRMIRRQAQVMGVALAVRIGPPESERSLVDEGDLVPPRPGDLPFEVDDLEDLDTEIRVEIELLRVPSEAERATLFEALAVWDAVVAALGDENQWEEELDAETRMFSSTSVEHEINGYFADYNALDLLVWFGLALHPHLGIRRISFE